MVTFGFVNAVFVFSPPAVVFIWCLWIGEWFNISELSELSVARQTANDRPLYWLVQEGEVQGPESRFSETFFHLEMEGY